MKFIDLKYKINFDVLTLAHILEVKQENFWEILEKIKPLKFFNEYLQYGYYPFFIESGMNYSNRLMNTINIVLESDMPAIYHIDFYSVLKMKKMLALTQKAPDKGNLRETFFLNQLNVKHKVTYPKSGDFLVDEKYTFEIGGSK